MELVLCLILVFTLHLNIFNFQRVNDNVAFSLGFRRVSERFPQVFCKLLGFPQGFLRVSAGFQTFCEGFSEFLRVSMAFRRVSQVSCRSFNLRKVFQGFWRLGFLQICLQGLPGFLFRKF